MNRTTVIVFTKYIPSITITNYINMPVLSKALLVKGIVFLCTLIGVFIINRKVSAQSESSFKHQTIELKFVSYLVSSNQSNEALYLINKYEQMPIFKSFADTLLFLKGKVYYNQNKLTESANAFSQITPLFAHKTPITILEAYEHAHLNNLSKSTELLNAIQDTVKLTNELIKFQKASVNLLNKNTDAFNKYKAVQDTSFNELFDAQMKLNNYAFRLEHHKQKSPVLAGIMSAIIPGSGKMYTGKIGEGISTFLGMSILGAITYENYHKAGINNYKTITFASLFTVLYAGNIFGSVYSVKVYRSEFNESLKHAVLFNMHIPIRTVFPNIFE